MITINILTIGYLLLFLELVTAYALIFYAIKSKVKRGIAIATVFAILFLSISIGIEITDSNIEARCEKENISYTAVSTIAEYTGIDEKTVYNAMKIGRDNEYDLDIVIKYLDPNLTEEEVTAIVLTYAMVDRNMSNKVIEEP